MYEVLPTELSPISRNIRTFIFHEHTKDHKIDFKKAKIPIVDICVCIVLYIRKDLIDLLTNKMKLYNKRKHNNKVNRKICYFCDGTGKGYVFGEE